MSALNRTLLLAGIAIVVIAALLAIDPAASLATWHPSSSIIVATATIAPAAEKLDILIGAKAIAEFTGLSTNQVYHQHKIGALPIRQQGSLLIGSKSRLREHFGAAVERHTDQQVAG